MEARAERCRTPRFPYRRTGLQEFDIESVAKCNSIEKSGFTSRTAPPELIPGAASLLPFRRALRVIARTSRKMTTGNPMSSRPNDADIYALAVSGFDTTTDRFVKPDGEPQRVLLDRAFPDS